MSSSSDDENGLTLPSKLGSRIMLGKRLTIGRRKSTGQPAVQDPNTLLASPTTAGKPQEVRVEERTRLIRSHSNTSQHDCKAQWASALIAQEPMQKSLINLRSAVAAYESQASDQKWQELFLAQTHITADIGLATAALEKQQAKKGPLAAVLDKSSAIALEYTKLFDVVLDSCPEYARLAWGITKLLLVANINHARVKENIETHLASIGERLGLVNQLIYYAPTDAMVDAVALFYGHLSKFLGKALRCYAKSKLATALEAFAFPWEVKFQRVVDQINEQFRRIQALSSASHFGTSRQNHELLQSIRRCQQEDRESFQHIRSSEQLRREIKEELRGEMKREILDLLQSFDTKMVQRFDEILFQQTTLLKTRDESCVLDFVDSFAPSPPSIIKPEIFLARFAGEPESLSRFRNMVFPLLQKFDHREKYIRATKRTLTAYDYQHTMKVLRNPAMRTWLSSEESGIVWIDSQQVTKHADWMSVLVTHLIDDVARFKYTRLRYFCHGHSHDNSVSSAALLIQSLIFQLLLLNHKSFLMKDTKFTQKRFEDAQHDLDGLWALFLDVLVSGNVTCVWIFADHVDVLRRDADSEGQQNALKLLRWFNDLVERPQMTVKILITARIGGPVPLHKENADGLVLSPHHPIIHVPRGHHRSEATFVAKYSTKRSRLPDTGEPKSLEAPENAISVDNLLAESTSEDDDPSGANNVVCEYEESDREQLEKYEESTDSDTPSFLDEDVLLSSDSDDLTSPTNFRNENQRASLHLTKDLSSSPSSDEDDFLSEKSDHITQDDNWNLESSEEDDYRETTEVCKSSSLSPRIVVDLFDDPFGNHPGVSKSKADHGAHTVDEAVPPQESSTHVKTIIPKQPVKEAFPSESDTDSGFD